MNQRREERGRGREGGEGGGGAPGLCEPVARTSSTNSQVNVVKGDAMAGGGWRAACSVDCRGALQIPSEVNGAWGARQ